MYKAICGLIGGFIYGTVGFLVGSFAVFLVILFIVNAIGEPASSGDMTTGSFVFWIVGPVATLLGAILGAVIDAVVGTIGGVVVGWRVGK